MLTADPSQGLFNVYNKVLEFVPKHCAQMMNITSGRYVASDVEMFGEQRAGIRGFDFLVNAVWPEVVGLIDARFGSIFAPGNPDAFHQVFDDNNDKIIKTITTSILTTSPVGLFKATTIQSHHK